MPKQTPATIKATDDDDLEFPEPGENGAEDEEEEEEGDEKPDATGKTRVSLIKKAVCKLLGEHISISQEDLIDLLKERLTATDELEAKLAKAVEFKRQLNDLKKKLVMLVMPKFDDDDE